MVLCISSDPMAYNTARAGRSPRPALRGKMKTAHTNRKITQCVWPECCICPCEFRASYKPFPLSLCGVLGKGRETRTAVEIGIMRHKEAWGLG